VGESKNKKQRFLAGHPHCCFCGGSEPATTVDHVPPRTCFPGRHAPEGFEFPACVRCQGATRQEEQAFSLFVRTNDPSDDNYRSEEVIKAFQGVRNNLPHLLPFGIDGSTKRKALRSKGLRKPANMLIEDVSMVAFPPAIGPVIHRYARKIAAALYYREMGKAANADCAIWTHWGQAVDQVEMPAFLKVAGMTRFKTIGARANLDFGDRFGYVFDKDDEGDLFMAIVQFGKGLVIVILVACNESARNLQEEGWIKVSAIFD
jgi:hypothetical protein